MSLLVFQRVTAELEVEKGRLGEMQQMEAISKAIAYGNSRRKQAEVRCVCLGLPSTPSLWPGKSTCSALWSCCLLSLVPLALTFSTIIVQGTACQYRKIEYYVFTKNTQDYQQTRDLSPLTKKTEDCVFTKNTQDCQQPRDLSPLTKKQKIMSEPKTRKITNKHKICLL